MKYIRTKDGRIAEWEETGEIKFINGFHSVYKYFNGYTKEHYEYVNELLKKWQKTEIIKQADTIEELCDEFVYQIDKYHYYNDELEIAKGLCDDITKIYGAIWTDKGLIYVAKMNNKGELVLL